MKITPAQVYASLCRTQGAENATVYGIQVCFESGETVFCPDLNTNRNVAERLCSLLPGYEVDTASLWEVFEDFASISE